LSDGNEARNAAHAAADHLHHGLPGEVGEPLPIRSPAGECVGWFVPSTSGGRLVGFHQLRPDLVPMRWSEFQADVAVDAWTDPARVHESAAKELMPGETTGQPVLTYDGHPDRLAWAVPVIGPQRGAAIFVAGSAVWRGPWPTASHG
jgi:hypothetical protein